MKSENFPGTFLKKHEQKIILCILVALMLIFFGFGLYHLSKFETVDEHFWKYERISKYWEGIKLGIKEGKWKKTYINDKPGVTVALFSGSGLLFEPHPELHRNRDPKVTDNENYTVYNQDQTERLNFLFRFPLLLFNTLLLPLFYWLIKKITNKKIALLTTILIATSPVLIGMSQIINPDALSWSFSGLAIFSFLALLKSGQKKLLALAALSSGMAILSKYTANILFPLYILTIFSSVYFGEGEIVTSQSTFEKYSKKQLFNFLTIFLSSILLYGIFMPAAFEKTKYLYEGTIGSPASAAFFWPLVVFVTLWALDTYALKSKIAYYSIAFLRRFRKALLVGVLAVFTFFFLFILINPHLANPIVPLDDVKENSAIDGELIFPQLENFGTLSRAILMYSIELQPFIFSLTPLVIFSLLVLLGMVFYVKSDKRYHSYIFVFLVFLLIYFAGNLFSGVLVNPRYAIMLYPLICFLSAIGLWQLMKLSVFAKRYYLLFFLVIIFLGLVSLWKIKPFYLDYESFLLPKQYVLTDAWGYGEYEAAQYLNSLENSQDIVVWSDRSALYQFINGKGIRDYKIDLNKTRPQYFVLSRRGSIRHKFLWQTPQLAPQKNTYYYEDDCPDVVWELAIGGRSDNYVKIVRVDYE